MTKTEKALELKRQNTINRHQGELFEGLIMAACDFYRMKGVADIEKTPENMRTLKNLGGGKFQAIYVSKAQADFKGFLEGGRAVCFEAKFTATGKMERDRVTPEQGERLERAFQYGALSFVLCSFGRDGIYRVPWKVWRSMKELFGHKYMTPAEAAPYAVRIGGPGVLLFLEGAE